MTLEGLRRDWDALGRVDPFWAVLAFPERRAGGWDEETFFATGEAEVARVMDEIGRLRPGLRLARALDFGCGVGRLTRALASRFESCVGVDISEEMVERARSLNRDVAGCEFKVNTAEDLALFEDGTFDFVYSSIVLQHLPDRERALGYVREFMRVLAPGGMAAFQVPHRIPWRRRLQLRRRAHGVLSRLGVDETFLHQSLGLHPIRLIAVPEPEVVEAVERAGGRVLEAQENDFAGRDVPGRMYFAQKPGGAGA